MKIQDYLNVREHPGNTWARMPRHDRYVRLLVGGPLWDLLDISFRRDGPEFNVPFPVRLTQPRKVRNHRLAEADEIVETTTETWTRERFRWHGKGKSQIGFLCNGGGDLKWTPC